MAIAIFDKAISEREFQRDVVAYLQTLIRFESVTPNQAGAIDWLTRELSDLGLQCEHFNVNGVSNLIASISFGTGPCVAFSGHIDVVPAATGQWLSPPFAGNIVCDSVYGRGAADMKGGVAAMLSATNNLINNSENKQGTLYWLITSDEEGEAEFGSQVIVNKLAEQGVVLDGCIVGEPTSHMCVGDTIKNGRRGALSARIKVTGKAGHVAYPDNTINAAFIAAKIVNYLSEQTWQLDEQSSKTTLQVTGINIGNVIDNLVPAYCEVTFNVRYSHAYSSEAIKALLTQSLSEFAHYFTIEWERPCEPYYTADTHDWSLLSHVEQAIYKQTGCYPLLSTSGGTSDGRFFANNHTQVIECGVRNNTIHQVNEHVPISDLVKIEEIYSSLLEQVFLNS
ncbi:succinyl-diaminopimelate desuccinylase [Pseudoalteromonas fuliginea]|uniref:Succinyl-diaminopimelate desuccinylase n=1 Tax=Pseudoalteromonas fuliginea TaxID=1872678 RepID=A0ABQ6REX4_9GAMM|nr:succinyl-diaminopimelate desuccinylase [Pseudoalteromonas fuliginea]KAA1151591.1 succinyl-diaminopimelate desuccinylase [Pseudoalteromonas fuliginea]KAA1166058.1 succinyl-diaminopimelate desuccinylase [Pseudoalteromonas fuliginea]